MMSRRGFTLVELVLVIVITLILTSTAIHGLAGVTDWRAAAAVRRAHADVTHARSQAMLTGRRTLCIFDADSSTYELRQEATPGSGPLAAEILDHPLSGQAWQVMLRDLSSGLEIDSAPTPAFGFGRDGLPIDSSGAYLDDDIDITFSGGATLRVLAGSGLLEMSWP
jgi:prepilin-type N-terminal cleavage/methylation domain-containing protein